MMPPVVKNILNTYFLMTSSALCCNSTEPDMVAVESVGWPGLAAASNTYVLTIFRLLNAKGTEQPSRTRQKLPVSAKQLLWNHSPDRPYLAQPEIWAMVRPGQHRPCRVRAGTCKIFEALAAAELTPSSLKQSTPVIPSTPVKSPRKAIALWLANGLY